MTFTEAIETINGGIDCPGCTIYYVSIAYIENGKLEHMTYIAEER